MPRDRRADLGQRVLGLLERLVQQRVGPVRIVGQPPLGRRDVHPQPDQPLLRAVVQVALEAPQGVHLGLAGGRPALGQLADLLPQRRVCGRPACRAPTARVQPDQTAQHRAVW